MNKKIMKTRLKMFLLGYLMKYNLQTKWWRLTDFITNI